MVLPLKALYARAACMRGRFSYLSVRYLVFGITGIMASAECLYENLTKCDS